MWEEENTKKPLLGDNKEKVESKRGPEEKRSCNDILFMLLFVACCVAFGIIAIVGFHKGDPSQLISSKSPEWAQNYAEGQVQGGFTNAVAQLKEDSDVLAGSVAIAIVLGFIWIELMKKFTKAFIYGTLFAGVAAVVALGAYVVNFGSNHGNQDVRIIGFVVLGLAVLLFLAILFLRNKINLTAAMFTECCRGVQNNIALFPVLASVMSVFIGFAALWVGAFIYLWSIPDSTVDVTVGSDAPQFNESVRSLMLYQVFAFLWITCFLSAVYQHVVAGAVAGWYFSRDMNSTRPKGPFAVTSLFHAVTTSFGSLAFGSLVLAFVQFLGFLLKLVQKQNYKNRVMVAVVGCLQCLVSCVEGIVKYINKFAYIYVAMHGYSFCTAARECFDLISRNFFNAVIMDTIGGFVLFVGQVLFTAVTTMITIGMLDGLGRVVSPVTITLVVVFSFAVLHILSQVIAVGVDTVFVCYLEDLELNKGDNMYISPDLHNMLQERVEKYKNADGSKA